MFDKESVERIILETLPQDKTEGIYIFGSYNSKFFDDDSDIDIGWFCKGVTDEERVLLEYELEQKIGREVDNTFFIILNKYRNSACHRYKQPSVEEIRNFYNTRNEQIISILNDLEKITSKI